jgi:hypothetical protein
MHINIILKEKKIENLLKIPKDIPKYSEPEVNDYNDYDRLVDEEIELEYAEEWLNNSIIFLENRGKLVYLIINKDYDVDTGEMSFEYVFQDPDTVEKSLCRMKTNIINPKYDAKLANKCEKDKKLFDTLTNEQKNSTIRYLYTELSNKQKTGFLDDYRSHRKRGSELYPTRRYSQTDYYPFLKRNGEPDLKGKFNLFTGFPLEDVKLIKKINFENSKLYKHIRDVLCNENIKEFNHILDTIADMIQDPANHKSNSHIFYSKLQGVGKGLLVQFLTTLLGKNNVIVFDNTETYFNNFNLATAYKILKVFEEVKDKGVAHSNHNVLKSDIAKKKERVEAKFKEVFFLRHCARYLFNTNNENALNIEPSDRRFTCHSANCDVANDIIYFKEIVKEIEDEQFCKNAFEYFAERKYDQINVRTCYQNYFKIQQKLKDTPYGVRFIKDLIEKKIDKKIIINDKLNLIKQSTMDDVFKFWCEQNGCKQFYNVSKLKEHLKLIDLQPVYINFQNGSKKGAKQWCYEMDRSKLLRGFKNYLKIEGEFKFDMDAELENIKEELCEKYKNKIDPLGDQIIINDDSDSSDNE